MSTRYVVKAGDTLGKIALAHGFRSYKDIYDHPDNTAFRAKRPNPNLIFPGDVLMIPNKISPPVPPIPPPPPFPTVFHPGVNHAHSPSGRWAEVQANPNSPGAMMGLIAACKMMNPQELVDTAIKFEFCHKQIALKHLKWYLTEGKGRDFLEGDNIKAMLERDQGVQAAIGRYIPRGHTSGTFTSNFKLQQSDYANQDFCFAFGAIDRLDFEVDFGRGTIHVWFQDRYEWHPVYPGLYKQFPDDVARETNCVHAALVELKSSGAADFWMKGEATVPLNLIVTGYHSTSNDSAK